MNSQRVEDLLDMVKRRLRVSLLGLAYLVIAFTGCSQHRTAEDTVEDTVEDNGSSEPSTSVQRESTTPSGDLSSIDPPKVNPIVAAGDTKESTSLWSKPIKSQLARIGDTLLSGKTADSITPFADQIEAHSLDQFLSREVYQGRQSESPNANRPLVQNSMPCKLASSSTSCEELLFLTPNTADESVYFKLYGIHRDGDELITRQRLATRGTNDGKPVRSYAVVDTTWLPPPRVAKRSIHALSDFRCRRLCKTS